MKRFIALLMTFALMGTLISVPAAAAPSEQSYIVVAKGNSLPAGLAKQLSSAGGTVTDTIPEIGVAVVSSSDASFKTKAGKINGVQTVFPNLRIQGIDPVPAVAYEATGDPPNSGSADALFDLQWGHTAIGAPTAWNAGLRGDGVRVAVLDDGIDSDHPDLAPNLNVALSTSFIPGETFEYDSGDPDDPFSHGSHTSGTIAAAENGLGTIGVAPDAEIVMVKVLASATGSGTWDSVAQGIVFAANIDADIINMSLGAELQRRGFCEEDNGAVVCYSAREVAEIANTLGRATTYAYQQGTTIIASAGNDAMNSNQSKDVFHLPSDAPHVISISASAPIGWAVDNDGGFDNLASYSNYGLSTIDFAAPGGDVAYPGNENCVVAGLLRPCWVFDLVFSTGSAGNYYWSAGTSMAAPHASGVAAMIIGMNGGDMQPAHVEAALRASAIDYGKPGRDPFFGHGQVSAAGLVQ